MLEARLERIERPAAHPELYGGGRAGEHVVEAIDGWAPAVDSLDAREEARRPAGIEAHDVSDTVRVGVVGLGYWGPNLARNFAALEGCELRWCCDLSAEARERWAKTLSVSAASPPTSTSCWAIRSSTRSSIATAFPSHAALALRVLAGGQALLRREAARALGRGGGRRRRRRRRLRPHADGRPSARVPPGRRTS